MLQKRTRAPRIGGRVCPVSNHDQSASPTPTSPTALAQVTLCFLDLAFLIEVRLDEPLMQRERSPRRLEDLPAIDDAQRVIHAQPKPLQDGGQVPGIDAVAVDRGLTPYRFEPGPGREKPSAGDDCRAPGRAGQWRLTRVRVLPTALRRMRRRRGDRHAGGFRASASPNGRRNGGKRPVLRAFPGRPGWAVMAFHGQYDEPRPLIHRRARPPAPCRAPAHPGWAGRRRDLPAEFRVAAAGSGRRRSACPHFAARTRRPRGYARGRESGRCSGGRLARARDRQGAAR